MDVFRQVLLQVCDHVGVDEKQVAAQRLVDQVLLRVKHEHDVAQLVHVQAIIGHRNAELKKFSQSCFRVDAFPGDRLLNRLLFGGVGVLHFRGFGEVSVFNQHRDQPFQCVRVVAIRGSIAVDRHAADVICVGRGEPVHRGGAGQLRNRADHLLAVRGVRLKCHA